MKLELLATEVAHGTLAAVHEGWLWCNKGWKAQGLKHLGEDDWTALTTRHGREKGIPVDLPAMGRDKNDLGPLNMAATLNVLSRTSGEVLYLAAQYEYALAHQGVTVVAQCEANTVLVDIASDHDEPSGMIAANNSLGERQACAKVQPCLWTHAGSASAWFESGSLAHH